MSATTVETRTAHQIHSDAEIIAAALLEAIEAHDYDRIEALRDKLEPALRTRTAPAIVTEAWSAWDYDRNRRTRQITPVAQELEGWSGVVTLDLAVSSLHLSETLRSPAIRAAIDAARAFENTYQENLPWLTPEFGEVLADLNRTVRRHVRESFGMDAVVKVVLPHPANA